MRELDFGGLAELLQRRVDIGSGLGAGGGPEVDAAGTGGVGGLAWAVSVAGRVASGSAGWLDPDRRQRPLPADALFRIASVTKPIVAVAALQLVDAGLVGLDDPLDPVLPELADRRVLVDPSGPLDQPTVPAERPLTLRDLLTFRCGLGMDFDAAVPQPLLEQLWEWGVGPGPVPPDHPPDEFMALLGRLPLADQPGTRWRYHTGSDIVSVLIERVRGETLDRVLARHVFGPLGMVDTGFWVPPDRRSRLGACRSVDDGGEMVVWDAPDGRWSEPPSFRSGATGLVSTTADLISFGQALLRGGAAPSGPMPSRPPSPPGPSSPPGGAAPSGPMLSPRLVEDMTRDQLTAEQARAARIDSEGGGVGWGLGVGVRRRTDPAGWPPAGSYGWDGGLGSRWLVDPSRDLCAVLLTTDSFSSPSVLPLLDEFVAAVGKAVGATR